MSMRLPTIFGGAFAEILGCFVENMDTKPAMCNFGGLSKQAKHLLDSDHCTRNRGERAQTHLFTYHCCGFVNVTFFITKKKNSYWATCRRNDWN